MCPEKRKERSKNQVYTCTVDDCNTDFIKKNEFSKHAMFSHCLAVKNIVAVPPLYKSVNTFYLHTTPATRAARILFQSKNKTYFKQRLARNPCTLKIDYKSVRNEWESKNPSLTIKKILDQHKARVKNKYLIYEKIKEEELDRSKSREELENSKCIGSMNLRSSTSNTNLNSNKRALENTPPSSKHSSNPSSTSSSPTSTRLNEILNLLQTKTVQENIQSRKKFKKEQDASSINLKPKDNGNSSILSESFSNEFRSTMNNLTRNLLNKSTTSTSLTPKIQNNKFNNSNSSSKKMSSSKENIRSRKQNNENNQSSSIVLMSPDICASNLSTNNSLIINKSMHDSFSNLRTRLRYSNSKIEEANLQSKKKK
jgi:hypothetical protein